MGCAFLYASHKLIRIMKTKILAITVLLCCLYTIYVFGAPEENYKVLSKNTITRIEVFGDCEIVIAEIAPEGKNTIYGDNVNNTTYGGNKEKLFQRNQVKPNRDKEGIKIYRNKDKRVVLSVQYSKIFEETEIQIVTAEYKDSIQALQENALAGYFPGPSFKISVKKGSMNGNADATTDADNVAPQSGGNTVHNASETEKLQKDIDKLNQEVSQLKKEIKYSDRYDILLLFIALIGLSIGYFLFKKNRKYLKGLSEECSDLKKVVNNKEKENRVQMDSHQSTSQKDNGRVSMTDDDIKRFIVDQITSFLTQFSPSTLQTTVAVSSNVDSITNPVKKEEQVINTDNVKFHQGDNSFTLEQTDIKIFRIYSQEGEFYYTIVNDSAVREELIGMLQMFEGCLTYQTTDGVAKRVEPVTAGKLRKDGNKFYVDANNKLVVKFA